MGEIGWPGAATQFWMALIAGAIMLWHFGYYSVWKRWPEWRLRWREWRGERPGIAEWEEISRSRSWIDEGLLEKNGANTTLLLGLWAAVSVWMFRDFEAETGELVTHGMVFAIAAVGLLWTIAQGEVEEVGAPPPVVEEPDNPVEARLGPLGRRALHVAWAAVALAGAYYLS